MFTLLARLMGAVVAFFVVLSARAAAANASGEAAGSEEEKPVRVAILVIDDFGLNKEEEDGDEGNCTEAADGQVFAAGGAVFAAGGAASSLVNLAEAANLPLTHGDLVWTKFHDLLGHVNGAVERPAAPPTYGKAWIPQESVWDIGRVELRLIAVDTAGFHTDTISKNIRDSITVLQNAGVNRVVLNMSFAIIPCEELDDDAYLAMVDDELKDLKETLQGKGVSDAEIRTRLGTLARTRVFYEPVTPPDQAEQSKQYESHDWPPAFLDRLADDPLQQLFQEPPAGVEMINVAAAGNAGRDYPYAPAIWTNVLGVGSAGIRNEHHRYANNGEVIAYDVVEVEHADGGTIPVHGSSFAAPEVSVRAALHLARGGQATCAGGAMSTTPPLAYAGVNGSWDNLPLLAARNQYCPAFPVDLS